MTLRIAVLVVLIFGPTAGFSLSQAGALAEARERLQAGDTAGAITLLELVRTDASPANDDALLLLARLYLQKRRVADAYGVLSLLAQRDDAPAALLLDAGKMAAAVKRHDEAIALLVRAVAADPASEGRRLLGMLYMGQRDRRNAYAELRHWSLSHPDDIEARLAAAFCAIQLLRVAEAEELLADIALGAPGVRILWGEIRILRAEYRAAIELLAPIRATAPPSFETPLRRLLSRAYISDGKPEAAVELLTGRTETNAELAWLLAEALYKVGETPRAVAVLEPHATRADASPELVQDLGRYLLLVGAGGGRGGRPRAGDRADPGAPPLVAEPEPRVFSPRAAATTPSPRPSGRAS